MAIYKMVGEKERLESVSETSFLQENIREDPDLRYMLRDLPNVIEEGLFILSEEFSGHWQGSGRSIDLLALDARGRLVVIEIKRSSTGDHAELQAIRYAAMVSVLSSDQITEAHQAYLDKWKIGGDAVERIREHLETTEFDDIYTETPRIILVSRDFSKELTTSVLWLNENGLDITCVQLQPYMNGPEILLESSQVIPVPGTEDLLIQAQEKRNENRRQRTASLSQISFSESVETVSPEFSSNMELLLNWAQSLEHDKLAVLEDNSRKYGNLRIRSYRTRKALAKVNSGQDSKKGSLAVLGSF